MSEAEGVEWVGGGASGGAAEEGKLGCMKKRKRKKEMEAEEKMGLEV